MFLAGQSSHTQREKAGNNVRYELGDYTNVLETSLGIRNAHGTIQKVDAPVATRVVVAEKMDQQRAVEIRINDLRRV